MSEGVCTPQGVWIRAIGRAGSSLTERHSELRHKSQQGYMFAQEYEKLV